MTACRKIILTIMLVAGIAQAAWADDCSKISSAGSAKKLVKPDVAYITIFVNGDGVLMSDAAKKADDNVRTVINAIREGRTKDLNIKVTTIEVGEKSSRVWSGEQQNAPPRPQVSKQLQIVIPPDPKLAYDIIDAAIRAGAILTRDSMTQYPGELRGTVVYGVRDGAAIEEELRKEAIADARRQAEKMAQWAGKRVGQLCSIGCQSITAWPESIVFDGRRTDYPTKYLSPDSEQIEVKTSISMTFDLQ